MPPGQLLVSNAAQRDSSHASGRTPSRRGRIQSALGDLATEAVKIAAHGLQRRNRTNRNGADESIFVEPLIEIVSSGQTPAERKLELFHGAWKGSVDPVFSEFAY